MSRTAPTDHPIHPLLAERWSPRAFADRPVAEADLLTVLEAARWSPSSANEQPWNFIVATSGEPEEHARAVSLLMGGNQPWAVSAPVLMFITTHKNWSANGRPNNHARHDVGIALMSMMVQATSMGLVVHAMGGIHADQIHAAYGLPDDIEVVTGVAMGYLGDAAQLAEPFLSRESTPRNRKPLSELVFTGAWGSRRVNG